MVKLKVNGIEVEMPKEATLLEAIRKAGADVPTLCFNPMVSPYAVCRLCTVEMVSKGWPKMVTACNHPVREGVEVFTESERTIKARKTNLELTWLKFAHQTIPFRF